MKFLVTASLTENGLERLKQFGQVEYAPMAETKMLLGGSRLVKALEGVDVFITEADNVRKHNLEKLPYLQVICSCRGNPVNIDIPAASEKGIPVIRVAGRNAQGVAELAVGLMIMLGRNIMQTASALRRTNTKEDMTLMSRIYFDLKGHELWQKNIGILGFGAIGRKVSQLLTPFDCHFFAFDPFVDERVMKEYAAQKTDLKTLLKESDYVTVHVMPSDDNKGMIGAEEIALMKSTAYFINTARSWVTDEKALFAALRDKKIAGAGFDVYDKEPLSIDHPFMSLDNVILLPHIGGNTYEVTAHQTEVLIPDIEKLFNGKTPENIVNPEVLKDFQLRM